MDKGIENSLTYRIMGKRIGLYPCFFMIRNGSLQVLEINQVNVKATTEEGLGFTGEGAGISSQAVCCLEPIYDNAGLVSSIDGTAQEIPQAPAGCSGGCGACPSAAQCGKSV